MNVRQEILPLSRVMAVVLGIAAAGVAVGEPIRFSKPFIALAAPAKKPGRQPEPRTERSEFFKPEMEQPRISQPVVAVAAPSKIPGHLPAPREKGMDFSTPEMAPPMAPWTQQQPMRRPEPRDEAQDDTPRLLRMPKIFTDPDETKANRKATDNTSAPGRGTTRNPWASDSANREGDDAKRALSPVTDFEWDPHGSRSKLGDSTKNGKPTTRDRNGNDTRTRSPFATADEANARPDASRPNGASDLFGPRTKEKLSAARLQRDAEFQQLLNPNAGSAAKTPNALEPVVSAANATPSTLATPTIGGPRLATPSEPMTAFNPQHDRLRNPTYDGYDKKNSPPPAAPAPSYLDPRYQPPLNRQPAIHEFPTRKF